MHQADPDDEKRYSTRQEATRKDMERCLGVMQARFEIVSRENGLWNKLEVVRISNTCVILRNLLIRMVQFGKVVIGVVQI